jgi:hypothetical protein
VFEYFRQAGFVDCKINAFPYNTEHTVDLDVKNRAAATFIMIDLDLKDFRDDQKALYRCLKRTLDNFSSNFNGGAYPTVLWTGNGYHIYQPIEGMVFETHEVFFKFLPYVDKDLTTEFLRFAERFFTDGKSDPQHLPSIKSCLVRVPGTLNSKNGDHVRIAQRWDGKRPAIQHITTPYRTWLIQKRIDRIEERKKERERRSLATSFGRQAPNSIGWIERLLRTPLEDYRKQCLWRILVPYLVNVRKLSRDESVPILEEWLQQCAKIRKLDFSQQIYIKNNMGHVGTFLPHSKQKLKKDFPDLYRMLKSKDVITLD